MSLMKIGPQDKGKYRVTAENGIIVNFFVSDENNIMMSMEREKQGKYVLTKIDPKKFKVEVGSSAIIFYYKSHDNSPMTLEGNYLPTVTEIELISKNVF